MRSGARVRLLVAGFALATLAVAAPSRAATSTPDAPTRWVTDHAGFLSPAVAGELDQRLGAYAAGTGHQLLVYIDHTTSGDPIEDWGARTFQHWRVGRKGIDDGVVLFIFSDDHKLRLEVGYGLEAVLPDAAASRIINDRMVPLIRAGDRDGAVGSGVDAVIAAIGAPPGQSAGAPAAPLPTWKLVMGGVMLLLLIGLAVTHPGLAWLMLMSIGSGRGGGGGFSGGGGGGGFSGGGGSSGGGGASGSW